LLPLQRSSHKINPGERKKVNNMKIITPLVRNSMKRSRRPAVAGLLTALVLTCFALLPRVQAVVPAPDGGYAGQNTAEGTQALFSLTTGIFNTADGFHALFHDTGGNYNTAIGGQALASDLGGSNNT